MANILYLASKSPSRQQLLREAEIPFQVVPQTADESACDWGLPLDRLVSSIAHHKMEHADLSGIDSKLGTIFVLTADTMGQNNDGGAIEGKPTDREDAIRKIKSARTGSRLCSAFCVDRREWQDGQWMIADRIEQVVHARYRFIIPDEWIEQYLQNSFGLKCSNAIAVEGYGGQFLQEVQGSYTAIVGLPMYEVREALGKLGFFNS